MSKLLPALKNVAIMLISLLLPLREIAVAVLVLVLIDTVLGVWAASRAGEAITSGKLKRIISKLLLYYCAIIVGYIAGTYLVDNMLPIEKMITTLIGVVEVKSVLENLDIISGGDFFKSVLNKLDKSNEEDK